MFVFTDEITCYFPVSSGKQGPSLNHFFIFLPSIAFTEFVCNQGTEKYKWKIIRTNRIAKFYIKMAFVAMLS